jgi:hypothetical protein
VQDKKQTQKTQKQTKQTKTPKSKQHKTDTKTKTSTAGGQLISSWTIGGCAKR